MNEILPALVTGIITLAGVLISNGRSQAVTETKLEELTREVREHNNFARRVPLLEKEVETIQTDIKELQKLHQRQ